MAITMKDIAKAAEVSTATVSKVINGTDQHLSQRTRTRILGIIEEMGYVPNAVAKGLKVKRTNMLGFILPDICNPFFPEVARGIADTARHYGFGMVMCNTDDDDRLEQESFRFLSSRMVDGIVIIRSLRRGQLGQFRDVDIPIVMVDRESDSKELNFGQVFIDTEQATYESTRCMIKAGCKSIAFISARNVSPFDRYYGYQRALLEAGISEDQALVYRDRYNIMTGADGIRHILSDRTPDGIVCGNDLIAVGAINALRERGLDVPADVCVMGFDDIYFSRHLNPPLSTVRQPAYNMGAEAAKMLIESILYKKPLYKKQLDFEILMRGTISYSE